MICTFVRLRWKFSSSYWSGFLLLCLLAGNPVQAQVGQWRSYVSLREITALTASETQVWVGTSGGVYSYEVDTGEIERFTTMEGLHGTTVRAITFDSSCGQAGCVWIGYSDGVLDRLDVDTRGVQAYRDIQRAGRYPSREIHRIVVHGDSLLIGTAFGLVVFDKQGTEVHDTYDRFGEITPATPVYDALVLAEPSGQRVLWVATGQGIARAASDASNLKDPSAWQVETSGLPAPEVFSLAYFQGGLYAGTAAGIARRGEHGSYTRLSATDQAVRELRVTEQGLLGLDLYTPLLIRDDGSQWRLQIPGYEQPVSIVLIGGDRLWVGDRQAGLVPGRVTWNGQPELAFLRDCTSSDARCYPDGPYFNQFERLTVDESGNVWAAGMLGQGTGFHKLDVQGAWTDYVEARTPGFNNRNSYQRIHAAADGSIWAASQGSGLVQITPEGELLFYTRQNSTLRSPEGESNLDYLYAGGVSSDREGRLWVTNVGSPQPLHVRERDGSWTALQFPTGCGGLTSINATFRDIYVDSFDQKWITVLDKQNFRRKLGLIVLDTRDTPSDQSDDVCRYFRRGSQRGQGLPSDSVSAVVESGDGLTYVATEKGLAYIVNTGTVAQDPNAALNWPVYAERGADGGSYPLQGLNLRDVVVDPAKQVWVATDMGVWLIAPLNGGYEEVLHFTSENSPLLSDDVGAVEVNPVTGEVFFATALGLVGYQGSATRPVAEAQDLHIYPNPAHMRDTGELSIYIDGLVAATEVMILTVDGSLVNRFAVQGGRAIWNGRNVDQQLVPGGVYLVVAVGRNGEDTAYGKVALIR